MLKILKLCAALVLLSVVVLTGCKNENKGEGEKGKAEKSFAETYVQYVDIWDGYKVSEFQHLEGKEYTYAVYELSNDNNKYLSVVVIRDGKALKTIRQDYHDFALVHPTTENLVSEIDVNFDGRNDVLLYGGSFGTQQMMLHSCYLSSDDGLENYLPFFEVSNPVIDGEDEIIRSSQRESAAVSTETVYEWVNGHLTATAELTFAPHDYVYNMYPDASEWLGEDKQIYMESTDRCVIEKQCISDDWYVNEVYISEKDERLCNEDTMWKLGSDNRGSLVYAVGVEKAE